MKVGHFWIRKCTNPAAAIDRNGSILDGYLLFNDLIEIAWKCLHENILLAKIVVTSI